MSRGRGAAPREQGSALVAAIWLVLLLSALGLGLALTASMEPTIARHTEDGWSAVSAAEAGVTAAAHGMASLDDWTPALAGAWTPAGLVPLPAGASIAVGPETLSVDALTFEINCGREDPCSAADVQEATADRPWGMNNPHWRVLGRLSTGPGHPADTAVPFEVVVWAGDDPAENDDDAGRDGGCPGEARPGPACGLGRLVLRAESFGLAGAHAAVTAAVTRCAPETGVRVHNWVRQGQ